MLSYVFYTLSLYIYLYINLFFILPFFVWWIKAVRNDKTESEPPSSSLSWRRTRCQDMSRAATVVHRAYRSGRPRRAGWSLGTASHLRWISPTTAHLHNVQHKYRFISIMYTWKSCWPPGLRPRSRWGSSRHDTPPDLQDGTPMAHECGARTLRLTLRPGLRCPNYGHLRVIQQQRLFYGHHTGHR